MQDLALLAVAAEAADDPLRLSWLPGGECGSTALIVAGGSTGNTTFNVKSYRTGHSLTAVIKLSSDMFPFVFC